MSKLPAQWRNRATEIEPYAPPVALALRTCADELEKHEQEGDGELISVAQAAIETGWSVDGIGGMIADGRVPNHGTKRRPKVRRGDIPRKPGFKPVDTTDLATAAVRKRA